MKPQTMIILLRALCVCVPDCNSLFIHTYMYVHIRQNTDTFHTQHQYIYNIQYIYNHNLIYSARYNIQN